MLLLSNEKYERLMGGKMNRAKSIVQVTSALLIMMGIIHTTMVIKNVAPNFPAEILQSGAYVLMVLGTLAFIAMSKKSLRDVGLFRVHFVRQLIVGGVIGGILLVVCGAFTGWRFFANGCSLYIVLSQLLVAFAEELFFRGYLLEMMKDVARTSERAVIISAFLFGIWHYPISHNIGLVIITFFLGAIYGTLRTLFEKTEKEIGIVSLSIAHWLFNVVL